MKHWGIIVVALVFLLGIPTSVATKVGAETQGTPLKAASSKHVRSMRVTGVVTEVTDTVLKIQKTVKGQTEIKEFVLEKPTGVQLKVGDRVNVTYIERDGLAIVEHITPARTIRKDIRKSPAPKATTSVPMSH